MGDGGGDGGGVGGGDLGSRSTIPIPDVQFGESGGEGGGEGGGVTSSSDEDSCSSTSIGAAVALADSVLLVPSFQAFRHSS